nr:uncharacterized protein LOC113818842 [Penaeus vannamei]
MEARRPATGITDQKETSGFIADMAAPADGRGHGEERERVEKCQDLRRETGRLWQLRKERVVPVVGGAPGSVAQESDRRIENLGAPGGVGAVLRTAVLGTARILTKGSEM